MGPALGAPAPNVTTRPARFRRMPLAPATRGCQSSGRANATNRAPPRCVRVAAAPLATATYCLPSTS